MTRISVSGRTTVFFVSKARRLGVRVKDFQGQDVIYLKLSLSIPYLHPGRHISFLSKSNHNKIFLYLQPESASCHPSSPHSYSFMIQVLEPQSPYLLPLHIHVFPSPVLPANLQVNVPQNTGLRTKPKTPVTLSLCMGCASSEMLCML